MKSIHVMSGNLQMHKTEIEDFYKIFLQGYRSRKSVHAIRLKINSKSAAQNLILLVGMLYKLLYNLATYQ